MYTTKKTRDKKIEKRKIKRKIAKKKKKQAQKKQEQTQKKYIEQQNKEIEKNDENSESVEIVVIETLNINLNNDDVKKMKYINFYSSVAEASEASVQHSDIEKKKSEIETKNYLVDEDVARFNALIATTNYDDFWNIRTHIRLFKTSSFNKEINDCE